MKKLLWLSITTFMLAAFCGCSKEKTEVADTEVKVSQVTDDTESEIATVTSEEVENTTENETISTESTTEDEQISTETTNESKITTTESTTENKTEEVEKRDDSEKETKKSVDSDTAGKNEDLYVGEYNSYDTNEPDLEIQKNGDGTYTIQIGIFRVTSLAKCVGEITEEGLFFTTDEMGKEVTGIITLTDDVATVTFDSGWTLTETKEYQYHKTSDVPNIYDPGW